MTIPIALSPYSSGLIIGCVSLIGITPTTSLLTTPLSFIRGKVHPSIPQHSLPTYALSTHLFIISAARKYAVVSAPAPLLIRFYPLLSSEKYKNTTTQTLNSPPKSLEASDIYPIFAVSLNTYNDGRKNKKDREKGREEKDRQNFGSCQEIKRKLDCQ